MGTVHLSDLIYNLEGLLNILKFEDSLWKENFRSYWADLEITYAVAIDKEKKEFDTEDIITINTSIECFKKTIESKLIN